MDLTGRAALVTGAGGGIGRGIALALAEHGADIVIGDIRLKEAEPVAAEVAAMGRRSTAVLLDVTDQQSIDNAVGSTIEHLGRIDILVNNAGVFAAPGWADRPRANADDWDWTHRVNLKGVAMMTDAVAPHMIERGDGKIVNIASTGGRQGNPVNPAYMASKAAVISLTQSSALELAPHNINVNAVCPGFVWTGMVESIEVHNSKTMPEMKGLSVREIYDKLVDRTIPLKRDQTPEDIGRLAAFLASDYARNITGQSINVCGGVRLN